MYMCHNLKHTYLFIHTWKSQMAINNSNIRGETKNRASPTLILFKDFIKFDEEINSVSYFNNKSATSFKKRKALKI